MLLPSVYHWLYITGMKTFIATAVLFAVAGLVVVEACRAFPMASTVAALVVTVAAIALSGKRVAR